MSGVRVKFLNREQVLPLLTKAARRLVEADPNVLEVSLFGSLARGNHTPRSDADICIILGQDSRNFVDRIPGFLDYFSKIGLKVEVFPYTAMEIRDMQDRGFLKRIEKEKVLLASRDTTQKSS
jgi:predicted nucleotidyltransferase